MIHELGIELNTYLKSKNCPIRCYDGPGVAATSWGDEYITIERDEGGDTFTGPAGTHRNPKVRFIRKQGIKLVLRSQATAAGALEFEHYRRCEHLLDLVLVGLEVVCANRQNGFEFRDGRFTVPTDLEKSETVAGAVYELRITVDRGVFEQDWKGNIAPEASPACLASTTRVALAGTEDDDNNVSTPVTGAETACDLTCPE